MAERARKGTAKSYREPKPTDGFAIRVADRSVNKVFPVGSYAICDRLRADATFVVGDMLYVERIRDGLKECTLRRVSRIRGQRMWLSTHSRVARHRDEIVYPAKPATEAIRLLGRVRGVFEDFYPEGACRVGGSALPNAIWFTLCGIEGAVERIRSKLGQRPEKNAPIGAAQ